MHKSAVHLFDLFILNIMHASFSCSGQTGVLHSPSFKHFAFSFYSFHTLVLAKSTVSMMMTAVHLFDDFIVIIMCFSTNCSGQTDVLHSPSSVNIDLIQIHALNDNT